VTVLEAIKRSAGFLEKKGVDSPRLQVELLLGHLLKVPRMNLYLNFERALTPAELDALRELVRRRGLREPLQHITGSTSFCGLELIVNGSVLVPRPETEQLAELGWEFLKAGASESAKISVASDAAVMALNEASPEWPRRIRTALDFGTGSGCLAIALAVKVPGAQVVAVDVSEDALKIARENAARHHVEMRIQFLAGDGFAAVPSGVRFDVIVANPPYIPTGEIATLEPEVRDHDPKLALNGGADGLRYYERLAREAGPFLQSGGRIMVEFGDGQAAEIRKMFEQQKWIVEQVKPDYSGRLRFLKARLAE
jgi:release factor glutamine methyltransferase